jgi:hypothetical protein
MDRECAVCGKEIEYGDGYIQQDDPRMYWHDGCYDATSLSAPVQPEPEAVCDVVTALRELADDASRM